MRTVTSSLWLSLLAVVDTPPEDRSNCEEVVMDNLEEAMAHTLRSLRRRAAGEHALPIADLIAMFVTEYRLTMEEAEAVTLAAMEYADLLFQQAGKDATWQQRQ